MNAAPPRGQLFISPGLMIMRANSPAPVFSDLPAGLAEELRKIPGTRIVAPEVWKICPPIEGRNLLARAATRFLTRQAAERFSSVQQRRHTQTER
ncbi:MAG: hypothetical protein ACHRXM_16945 [Isosphaerales bacterium]